MCNLKWSFKFQNTAQCFICLGWPDSWAYIRAAVFCHPLQWPWNYDGYHKLYHKIGQQNYFMWERKYVWVKKTTTENWVVKNYKCFDIWHLYTTKNSQQYASNAENKIKVKIQIKHSDRQTIISNNVNVPSLNLDVVFRMLSYIACNLTMKILSNIELPLVIRNNRTFPRRDTRIINMCNHRHKQPILCAVFLYAVQFIHPFIHSARPNFNNEFYHPLLTPYKHSFWWIQT